MAGKRVVNPGGGTVDPRRSGFGMIQYNAHPEFNQPPRNKRSPTTVKDVTHGAPLKSGLGDIKAEIAAKNAINRGARYMRRLRGEK